MDSSPYFLKRFATCSGKYTYSQSTLAEDMQSKVIELEFSAAKNSSDNNRFKKAALLALASSLMPENSKSISQMVNFLYMHAEIKQRHFEVELEEINKRTDWYKLVNDATYSLSSRLLQQLFQESVKAEECDALIVVCSTHSGFPGLSRKLQQKFGFSVTTLCFDITAQGCTGAPHGFLLAHQLLQTGRCKNVCLLCIDVLGTYCLSSKSLKLPAVSNIVANCLTSDGAAALVLGKTPGPQPIFSYKDSELFTRLWLDSLEYNVLSAGEDNQPYVWVGKEIQTRLVEELEKEVNPAMLEEPIFLHPGGVALMKLIRKKYPHLGGSTELSLSELEETGNIGAPSVLFVLKKALEHGNPITPRFRLVTFGPGKTTAILLIDGVEK